MAYLIASEDQKKKKKKADEEAEANEDHGRKKRESRSDEPTTPRVRSLPQKKTKVQRSEVNRLAKNAHSTLVSLIRVYM